MFTLVRDESVGKGWSGGRQLESWEPRGFDGAASACRGSSGCRLHHLKNKPRSVVGCVAVCPVISSLGGEVCEAFEIVSLVRCSNGSNVRSSSPLIFSVDPALALSFSLVRRTASGIMSFVVAPPTRDVDPELGWEQSHVLPSTTDETSELVISGSTQTTHRVGQDSWWSVGFHLVAAVNTAFILGYPALVMSYLGWAGGLITFIGGGLLSFYNNYLLGSLHETGGIRHIRYRDLCGHVYGRFMYMVTWITQYSNLSIANVGLIILGGQSLKVIAGVPGWTLANWITIAGVLYLVFAVAVPSSSALKYFSALSLVLSCIYTMIALVISIKDGVRAPPRDYSLPGSEINQAFNAIGALATIAFAFNTGILPEMQATIKRPTTTNIYKALGLQFTIGTIPFLALTLVGYWAYGNIVFPYLIINLSGPKWAIMFANVTAFLQALIVFHIFATPMYEFLDTFAAHKVAPKVLSQTSDFTVAKVSIRIVFRGVYMAISVFLGCLLPFFGDFIALTGSLAAFTLQGGFIHHMIIKVRGNNLSGARLAWHWLNVGVNAIVMIACVAASIHYIIHDSTTYHLFADL